MQKILYKTDKNGTKYYQIIERCSKCGGSGFIACYIQIEGGECFDCNGKGIIQYNEKEYTPEYEEKLNKKRIAKFEKKIALEKEHSAEKNQEFFQKNGFDENGKTYVVLGNTYEVKDTLKEKGCKWSNLIGWHTAEKFEGFEFVEIDVNDVFLKNYADVYLWNNWKNNEEETFSKKIQEANDALAEKIKKANPEMFSDYVAEVGTKIELDVVSVKKSSYETKFGVTLVYTFKDANNNILVWKTSSSYISGFEEGKKYTIKGTVKEHNNYKGTNQTILTRCKVD